MLKVCLRIVCNYACLHTEALLCVKVWKPFVAWGWEGKTERTNFKQLQRHKDWWQAGASVMSADLGNFILGICFHVCAMDLSGQTVSASNVSTSKITSRALCDFFFFLSEIYSARIFLRFVWLFYDSGPSAWISPYTVNSKHNSNLKSELYSQFIFWKYLENWIQFGQVKKTFYEDHLLNRFSFFLAPAAEVKTYTLETTRKKKPRGGWVKHYTFYFSLLMQNPMFNLDNSAVN